MKWSLQQLHKLSISEIAFDFTLDFKEEVSHIDDVLDIADVQVTGTAQHLYDDRFEFFLHIQTTLTLEDARSLDPVEFMVEMDVIEVFDVENPYDEDIHLIEKNTVDLKDVIWENILLEKPMRYSIVDDETFSNINKQEA